MKRKINSNIIRGKKMNLKRYLTGLIGFPIVALVLIFGNKYIIDVIFAIVAEISIHEYFNAISKKYIPIRALGYIAAALIAFIHIIPLGALITLAIMFIPLSVVILFLNIIFSSLKIEPKDIFATFFGICYIVVFILFIPILYASLNGKFLIWYILLIAWGTDTFAYTFGRLFGKHKLTPISPKKSVEGSIGGTIGAIAVTLVYTYIAQKYVDLGLSFSYVAIMTFALSILSQIGDLSASSIKRKMDIKDFGNLLPGHGGMLDRIDSMIFIAPFAYYILVLIL